MSFTILKGKKLTGEVLDELNYQFMRRLEKEGLITLKELYMMGQRSKRMPTGILLSGVDAQLSSAGLLDTIDTLYAEYNTFLH